MLHKIIKVMTFLTGLFASTAFAHTGVHNEIYHPLSGVDHFLVVLIVGVIFSVIYITIKNNRN